MSLRHTRIRPLEGRIPLALGDVWAHRDLLLLLSWRDVKLRYKQTVIGVAWAAMQPAVTALIFSLLFGRLVKVQTGGAPYGLFTLTALVPWVYFTHALTKASNSMVEHQNVITKVYFPRLVVPLAAVLAALVDFAIALVLLMALLPIFDIKLTLAFLTLPLFVLLLLSVTAGAGVWVAAMNVQYRDVANALPFVLQAGLFVTPIFYSETIIPAAWQPLYALNPMVGVVVGFRWAFLGGAPPSTLILAVSTASALILLYSGLRYFRNREDFFADVV